MHSGWSFRPSYPGGRSRIARAALPADRNANTACASCQGQPRASSVSEPRSSDNRYNRKASRAWWSGSGRRPSRQAHPTRLPKILQPPGPKQTEQLHTPLTAPLALSLLLMRNLLRLPGRTPARSSCAECAASCGERGKRQGTVSS